jgi:hypothetical protein
MPKVTKKASAKRKVAAVRKSPSRDFEAKQMTIAAVVVVSTVLVAPLVWLLFKSVWVLLGIPAVVSLGAAVMFKEYTGSAMTQEFRKETTTITAVFAVVLAVLASSNLPAIGLDGRPDTMLPIFMIIFMSVWAIIAVLVTVYLPLGVTIPKRK